MNITIDNLFQELTLVDSNFETHLQNFQEVEVSITHNCCVDKVFTDTIVPVEDSESESGEDLIIGQGDNSYIDSDYNIIIDKDIFLPLLLDTHITDGIYTITIKIFFEDYVLIYEVYNCIFVDYEVGCDVVSFMANNLGEDTATEIGVLYYALKNSDNCDCECENICILYRDLWNRLYNSENINICGC